MIEVVYKVMKTKQFKGKDAFKRAKIFGNSLHKKKSTDEVLLWNIRDMDGTNGYWEKNHKGTWEWCEQDG